MARLREPPDEDLVACFEEEHLRPNPAALQGAAHGPERHRRIARSDVEHDGDLAEAIGFVGDELGQLGQQLAGQIVDDGVAEVLEELGRGGLAASGQAAEDDDVLFRVGVGQVAACRRCGQVGVLGLSRGRHDRQSSAARATFRSAGWRGASARRAGTSFHRGRSG